MATTKYWKVWLTPNLLTKDVDNDYIAEVSTSKHTLRNEDIAQRIVAEGSEIKYDTLLSIINQHDRIIREAVCDGYSVLTGVGQYSPPRDGQLDRQERELRSRGEQAHPRHGAVEGDAQRFVGGRRGSAGREGERRSGNRPRDRHRDRQHGRHHHSGDDILIEGTKIKVTGAEETCGVFFVQHGAEGETAHKVERRLTQNAPSRIIARVPADLEAGEYTLRIVTQFTNSGSTLLKEPRTIEYDMPLTVS